MSKYEVNTTRVAKIGTTYGLVTDCGGEAPEQVYVNLVADRKRPIQIDGWVGYSTESRMHLTIIQAETLRDLLTKALEMQSCLVP